MNYATIFSYYVIQFEAMYQTFAKVNFNTYLSCLRWEIKIITMNTTESLGNWNERKGILQQKFADLAENDLMAEDGKTEEILGKLELKLGKTKEELRQIITPT